MSHGDRSQLQNELQLKKIINQSERHLTGREIELLALGLDFVPCSRTAEDVDSSSVLATGNVFCSQVRWMDDSNRGASKSSVRKYLSCETMPSKSSADNWQAHHEKLEEIHSIGITTGTKSRGKRSHPMPHQIAMDDKEVAEVAKMWNEQKAFYLTESDGLDGEAAGVVVLWSREHYELEAERYFSDKERYEQIAVNRFVPAVTKGELARVELLLKYHVNLLDIGGFLDEETLAEFKNAEKSDQKMMPYIHFQPKTDLPAHQTTGTFQARAVVETSVGPLHLLDCYLARVSAPIMTVLPGILNDSTELVQTTSWLTTEAQREDNKERENIMECDFGHETTSEFIGFATARASSNGYQHPLDCSFSIDRDKAVKAAALVYEANYEMLCHVAESENARQPVEPEKFKILLGFLFYNSFVSYGQKSLYRQQIGLPLGGRVALFVANSFIYMLTCHAIHSPPPWLIAFQRNLDRCLFLGCFHPSHGSDEVSKLLLYFTSKSKGAFRFERDFVNRDLKSGSSNGFSRECNFMDVKMTFHPDTRAFYSTANEKICCARSVVHRSSNHPPQFFENVLVSELTRIKHLSSTQCLFHGEASKMIKRLCSTRGYSIQECFNALAIVETVQP